MMKELEKETGAILQTSLVFMSENAEEVILLNVARLNGNAKETLERLKEVSDVPILMLNGNGKNGRCSDDAQLSADNPSSEATEKTELVRCARELVKQLELPPLETLPTYLTNGKLTVDLENRRVTVGGKPVKLTKTEYSLLACLAQRPGQALSQRAILARVWGYERRDDFCTLRTYIRRLRSRIESGRRRPKYIVNERGRGYKLVSVRQKAPGNGA